MFLSSLSELDNTEKLMNSPFSQNLKFEIFLVGAEEYLFSSCFQIEVESGKIIINVFNPKIKIKLSKKDILTVLAEEDLPSKTVSSMKNRIIQRYKSEKSLKKISDKMICRIHLLQRVEYKGCSFKNLFCFCCNGFFKNGNIYIKKSIDFLMNRQNYKTFIDEIYKKTVFERLISKTNIMNLLPKVKLLIIINPFSGDKGGQTIFKKTKEIFDLSKIEYDVKITLYKKHPYHYIKAVDLSIYHGVIIYGGDGTVHEIINGIMEREDSKKILSEIPIGIIPCGKNNGIATTIIKESRESLSYDAAAYIIVKGEVKKFDIAEIEIRNQKYYNTIYSVKDITFGTLANINNSCCKNITSFYNCLSLPFTQLKFYYLPYCSDYPLEKIPDLSKSISRSEKFTVINGRICYFINSNIPYISENFRPCSKAKVGNSYTDVVFLGEKAGKFDLFKQLYIHSTNGDYFNENGAIKRELKVRYITTRYYRIETPPEVSPLNLLIDGETYECSSYSVKVSHSINIFTINL